MKSVPKRRIRRIEENSENIEFQNMKIMLEMCREADDELWKQLIEIHLNDMELLNSEEERIKKELRRNL